MSNPTPAPTYSGQAIADLLNVEGIKLRRYIRSDGTRVGRGKTYAYTKEQAIEIAQGFAQKGHKDPLTEEQLTEVANLFETTEEEGTE